MKQLLIFAFALAIPFISYTQTIVKGAGILYTNGAPTHTVNVGVDAETAIDTASGLWYEWGRDAAAWGKAGFRIQHRNISVAPTGTPQDKESEIVVTDVDSLYQFRGGSWRHLNKVGDPSTTNELQTFANTSNSTTHTVTLSNSGGSFQLVEGAGIGLTTTGTTLDGVITISATDASTSNELQTYAHSGTTSYTNTLSNSGGAFTIQSTGIVSISHSAGTVTITATEVDGSTSNELQTYAHSGTSTYTNTLSSGGGSWSITGAGIAVISQTGGAITVTATEVDGSTSNELQTLANTSNSTTHTVTLSNSGGSFQLVEGANITLTTSGTGLDGIITIAATSGSGTDLAFTGTTSPVTLNSSTGTDVTFTATGIVSLAASGTNITITATEVDGSTSNELQTYAHAGTSTYTNTLSSGGGSWSITGAGIAVISQTGGAITVTATEVDGSTSNELQTLANTSNSTTHTVTLSNSGGSFQLVEGANITLTTTGTGLDGIITIAATGAGNTDLTFSGTSSPVTLNSSTGTDVTFTATGIVSLAGTSTNLTISATEVDGSTSNELQTYAHSGTSTYTNTLSSGGGSWSITGAGIAVISQTAGAITVTATEVDGSTSNELQTLANTSNSTTHTVTLSNSGGSFQLVEGAGIGLTTTGTGLDGIITISATDASTSNELQTYAHSGTTSYTNTLSNSGGAFTLQASGIVSISHSAGTVTISATEVDGSTSNELQTYAHAGTSTYTNTLSSGGGSWSITGAGIAVISQTGGAITVTATEVDGSTSNELQTYAHSGTSTYTNTLSNGGGSWSITGAGIAVVSQTSGAITVTATEVDGSTSNELQTLANTSNSTTHTVTLSNSGGSFQLVEGANITLTTTGTGLDGIITIAATSGSGTDLTFSGTSSPVTLNSSSGTDVTFTATGIVSLAASGTNITISATEVDGSTSNELQTYAHSGTTSYTNTLSNSGGAFTLQASGIASISHSAGTVTITATEVDGSTSNELQTYAHAGTSTYTNTLSSGGGSWSITGAGIAVISQTGGAITVTATEVDGSISNELQTYAHSGTTSYTNTLSNSGGAFTLQASGIVSISHSAGTVTISATEVDGSTSNELQTYAHSGTSTYTNTLSNGGGSWSITGAGIAVVSQTAGAITVTATEVDGSTSNEIQTLSFSNPNLTISGAGGNTISLASLVPTNVVLIGGNLTGATMTIGNNDANNFEIETNSVTHLIMNSSGITSLQGNGSAGSALQLLTLSAITTTGGTGFGSGISFNAQSSTTTDRFVGSVSGVFQVGTDASRIGNLLFIGGTSTTDNTLARMAPNAFNINAGNVFMRDAGLFTTNSTTAINFDGGAQTSTSLAKSVATITATYTAASGAGALKNLVLSPTYNLTGSQSGTQMGIEIAPTFTSLGGTSTFRGLYLNYNNASAFGVYQNGASSPNYFAGNVSIGTSTISNTLRVNGSLKFDLGSDATGDIFYRNSGGTISRLGVGTDGWVLTLVSGIPAWTASSSGSTDLAFTGTTSPVTLNSSTGTDVTFTAGGIVSLSASGTNITISATEVDGDASNELQTYAHSGTSTYTNTLSSGGGSWSITGAGIAVISQTGGAITVTATEVDGDASNEGLLGVSAGSSTTAVITSNSPTAAGVTMAAGTSMAISESTSSNGGTITIGVANDGITTAQILDVTIVNNDISNSANIANSKLANSGVTAGSYPNTGGVMPLITVNAKGIVTAVSMIPVDDDAANDLTKNDTVQTVNGSSTHSKYPTALAVQNAITSAISGAPANLTFSGASSPVTLASSTGTDVTFVSGTNVTLSQTGNALTINATGGGDILNGGNTTGAQMEIGSNDAFGLDFETNGLKKMGIDPDGGIDMDAYSTNANSLNTSLTLDAFTSATAGDGFGTRILFRGESSTTDNRILGYMAAKWKVAADASRVGIFEFYGGNSSSGALLALMEPNAFSVNNGVVYMGSSGLYTTGSSTISLSGSTQTSTSLAKSIATISGTYTAASGSGFMNGLVVSPTYNLTSSTSGVQNLIDLSPTITALGGTATIRGLNISYSNASAWAIYQSGSLSPNYFAGKVGIGTSSAATQLHVVGDIRADGMLTTRGIGGVAVVNLTNTTAVTGNNWQLTSDDDGDFSIGETGVGNTISMSGTTGDVNIPNKLSLSTLGTTATGFLGINASNQVSSVTVSGGSFSGGTFTIDPANLTFSGASSPVTLASSTGTDVTFVAGTNVTLSQTGNALTINATLSGGSGDLTNGGNTTGAIMNIGSNDNFPVQLEVNATPTVILGTDYTVTATATVSNTNTVADRLIIATNSTNVGTSNGFGGGILFRAESSTTVDRDQAQIQGYWPTASDGARSGGVKIRGAVSGTMTDLVTITSGSMAFASASYVISGGATAFTVGNTGALLTLSSQSTSTGAITLTASSESTAAGVRIGGTAHTSTTLAKSALIFNDTYAAASGSGALTAIDVNNTYNMTSTSTGIQRGLYIRPTLTSLVSSGEYRAVEITVNNSRAKAIYQTGASAFNNLVGKTSFGTTNQPSANVYIAGGASGANGAPLNIGLGSLMSTPEAGAIEYDGFRLYHTLGTNIRYIVPATIFTAVTAQTVANTTTETTLFGSGVGTTTIPSNTMPFGRTVRIKGGGVYSTPGTPGNIVVRVKLGGVTIATTTTAALAASATNKEFSFEITVTIRTIGGTGTAGVDGIFEYYTAAGVHAFEPLNNGGTAVTLATNASNPVDVTVQWDTASASKTITANVATVEFLN